MKWVEIIHLRTIHHQIDTLLDDLAEPARAFEPDKDLLAIKIYRHPRLDTDMSIHLHWNGDPREVLESALGLRLAHLFSEYGLADHSVWVEKAKGKGQKAQD
jgi:hypothetical protein